MRALAAVSFCGLAVVVSSSVYVRDADFYEPGIEIYERDADFFEPDMELYERDADVYEPYLELYERDASPNSYDALYELYADLYRRDAQAQGKGAKQAAGGQGKGAKQAPAGKSAGGKAADGTQGGGWPGVATFNNNAAQLADKTQGTTQCGVTANYNVYPYGAAVGDLSPNLSKKPQGGCGYVPPPGSQELQQLQQQNCVNGQSKISGPDCKSTTPCGTCYQISWTKAIGGAPIPGATLKPGTATVVKVIDACPHNSPWNYCKPDPPAPNGVSADQKCMSTKNALDLDWSVYKVLTGVEYTKDKKLPNLEISISPSSCDAPPPSGDKSAKGQPKGKTAKTPGTGGKKAAHRRRWVEDFDY